MLRSSTALGAALLLLATNAAAAKGPQVVAQLAGTYDGVHPHWRDAVVIKADGTYARGNGDPGTWTFDGKTLVLKWKNWGAEPVEFKSPGVFANAGGFSITQRNRPDSSAIPGTYDGAHPHWKDTVTVNADGTYKRGNGDPGTWIWDGTTLVLFWINWGPEPVAQKSPGRFSSPDGRFTVTKRGGEVAPVASRGQPCAVEGGRCQFGGTGTVWYGAKDKWVSRSFENGADCNNGVFGDPIVGTVKACSVVITGPQGEVCADEGGRCQFTGAATVFYGAQDKWAFKALENGTACTNEVFGDPNYGVRKQCRVLTKGPRGERCADEGGRCAFSGRATVWYGAKDKWVSKTFENGADCNNGVFGDPIYGTRKQCLRDGGSAVVPAVAPPPAPTPAPAAEGNASRLISTNKRTYRQGEPVVVSYTGFPGNATDWTNVVKAGEPTDEWGDWSYNSGAKGSRTVSGLEPGTYEARAYFDGSTDLADKVTFTVTP